MNSPQSENQVDAKFACPNCGMVSSPAETKERGDA
jgi:predicted RNA-binding Zn-ribbon protein involved in translation (DUF1610 family)